MDKRHAGFLQGEYDLEKEIAAEKYKIWEMEQKKKMYYQKHKDFDKIAERGPWSYGYDLLLTDPYFNPFPAEQQPSQPPKPSAPEKPAQPKPDAPPAKKPEAPPSKPESKP